MERVLDVYKRPYDVDCPVICMDETPKQLVSTRRESIPMRPGQPQKIDCEYIRMGVVNIFIANEPLAGKRYLQVTKTRKKKDWAYFIKRICDEFYPNARKITLVMDNLSTHKPSSLYETFPPHEAKRIWDRFEFIYTPKHGSWLNMAEIELHVLNGQCLSRYIDTIEEIEKEVNAWQNHKNNKDTKINWRFTNQEARIKLKRLYPSIQD
jgi:hypothetical protein